MKKHKQRAEWVMDETWSDASISVNTEPAELTHSNYT